jgi:hypothetical protein
MLIFLLLLALTKTDLATVQSEIQGLYEEIRQMEVQSTTGTDLDDLHSVLYTTDWTFVDKSGQKHTWPDLRPQGIAALAHHSVALYQPIKTLTLSSDTSTATVAITEYGVRYEDTWVKVADAWKMKMRRQLG